MNEKSRRFCQACRLEKCYKVGMKRDWTSQMKPKKEEESDESQEKWKRSRGSRAAGRGEQLQQPATATILPHTDQRPPAELPPRSPSVPPAVFPVMSMSEQVTIPKEVFMQLIHQAQARAKRECECECACGYYPAGTRLVAKNPKSSLVSPQPSSSSLALLTGPLSVPGLDSLSPATSGSSLDLLPPSSVSGMWTPPITWMDPIVPSLAMPAYNGRSSAGCYAPSPLIMNPPSTASLELTLPATPQMASENSPQQLLQQATTATAKKEDAEFSKNFAAIGRNPAVYEKLTIGHRSLLIELLKANESLRMPLSDPKKDVYTLLDAVKCADIAVRRMIDMAKNLRSFNELPNGDQMTLIKGGSMEMMILRGAMIYDPHNRSWKYDLKQGASEASQMEMSLDVLKGSEHFNAHQKFLATFDDRIRTNEVLMIVIHALLLFSPDRQGLRNQRAVQTIHDSYHDLILRILECEFSSSTSREMLTRIETVIKQLKALNSSMLEVVLGIDSNQIDPLIVEVFDLKAKNGL